MANRMKSQIERLQKLKADIRDEIAALQNKLEGIEMSIRALSADNGEGPLESTNYGQKRKRTKNVTETVLRLLTEAGPKGLSAVQTVYEAEKQGIKLERGTVSSLLSRLKREKTLTYNGSEYRLAEVGDNVIAPFRAAIK